MYLCFQDAFSDYPIPFKMSKSKFEEKILGKLNINFEFSVGAYKKNQNELLGFIFTTIEEYHNQLTAYNGGTGVRPTLRSHGLTQKMYDSLIPKLRERGITQCVLEVLVQNERAIQAYKKVGFTINKKLKCYKLHSYPLQDPTNEIRIVSKPNWSVYESFFSHQPSFLDSRKMLNKHIKHETIIEATVNNKCVGYVIFQAKLGRLSQIAVHPEYRNKGVGRDLICAMINETSHSTIMVLNIPEEALDMNTFFSRLGFVNELNQYEMILSL